MTSTYKRQIACFIDHILFTGVASVILIPGILVDVLRNPFEFSFNTGNVLLNTFALSIYLCKDVFFSKSPGKRLLKFRLVKTTSLTTPNSFQLFLRNTTFFIWPIEVLVLLVSPEQRIGDKLAGTRVIDDLEGADEAGSTGGSVIGKILAFVASLLASYVFVLLFEKVVGELNRLIQ